MKVINLLLYVVLLLSSLTQVKAQTNTKSLDTLSYMLSEGDVLLFDVIDNSNKYELKVTFTSVSEGKLDFEKILFDSNTFIYDNSYITGHDTVNVIDFQFSNFLL